jgi:hypothetical protein
MYYDLHTIRSHILAAKARSVCHMDFPSCSSPPARRKHAPASSRAIAALGLVATRHAVGRKDLPAEICHLRGTCLSRDDHYLSDASTR